MAVVAAREMREMRDMNNGVREEHIKTLEGQVNVNDFLKHYQVASIEEQFQVT
jgi:hypothetical protein